MIFILDPLRYTPPYGAFKDPPASSVTLSSNRTGFNSVDLNHQSGFMRNDLTSLALDPGASANGDLTANGSHVELFGHNQHQLNGFGSTLHTNTPVETISQIGGDFVSSGGIVYLGEVGRSLSPQDYYQIGNYDPSVNSDQSCKQRLFSQCIQYFPNQSIPYLKQTQRDVPGQSSKRLKKSNHNRRHSNYLKSCKSNHSNRTTLSESHMIDSSVSSTHLLTGNHDQTLTSQAKNSTDEQSIVFPVQL